MRGRVVSRIDGLQHRVLKQRRILRPERLEAATARPEVQTAESHYGSADDNLRESSESPAERM